MTFLVVIFGDFTTYYRQKTKVDNIMNPFFYFTIVAYIAAYFYAFLWDIIMDWGLSTD